MKIKKANAGPLTNCEVLSFLRSRETSKDPTCVMASLAPSELKVYDYLVEGAACNQTTKSINEFIEKSEKYNLFNAEIMNIINIRPSTEVELSPIMDEYEARMEDKAEEFLEMVAQVLPPPPNEANSDEEAAMNEPGEANDEEKTNAEEDVDTS